MSVKNLNNLYSFLKLLFYDVKKPYVLYEQCIAMTNDALNIIVRIIPNGTELLHFYEYLEN